MNIRNFCIIAHIDHGKSTLADRMLELTSTVRSLDSSQMLDTMDLEQERWITIKMTPVRMQRNGIEMNLIDTPGHVDFQYEVSRSLSAVEWVVLLVDASQWIQAQTLSTLYMALENNLTIIPVLNKVDLPAANVPRVTAELEKVIGIDPEEVIAISAKTWENVEVVLDAVIERIASPDTFHGNNHSSEQAWVSRALIFDSVFDPYKWVVAYVKVVEGSFVAKKEVQLIHSESAIIPPEVGHFDPKYVKDESISKWQIWYIVTGQKSVRDAKIGDTILSLPILQAKNKNHDIQQYIIPGFEAVKPFVFAWVYPIDSDEYDKLKTAFDKLSLNDSAISVEYEHSLAMGHGFRCWFLWMLHMDIVKERLVREYGMETIFTTPTVTYVVKSRDLKHEQILSGKNIKQMIHSGLREFLPTETMPPDALIEWKYYEVNYDNEYEKELKPRLVIKSWGDLPEQWMIEEIWEPIVEVEIVWPEEFSGNVMSLAQEYRGKMSGMEYLDDTRIVWKYLLPMGEIVVDFYDKLKSCTKGYATMNYEFKKYERNDLVRLDMLINHEKVEAFSLVVHKDKAHSAGRELVKKLKELIPKHMFAIPLQAWIWAKMIARETISAMRKDVIAKCYGWDVSRKKKLLKKQKEGKKKMKMMGRVSVPGDVFMKMVQR